MEKFENLKIEQLSLNEVAEINGGLMSTGPTGLIAIALSAMYATAKGFSAGSMFF